MTEIAMGIGILVFMIVGFIIMVVTDEGDRR